jgi:hypothetical protein
MHKRTKAFLPKDERNNKFFERCDAGKKVSLDLCGFDRICAEVPRQARLDAPGLTYGT